MTSSNTKDADGIIKPESEFGRFALVANMPLMMTSAVISKHIPQLEPHISDIYKKVGKKFINGQINNADLIGKYLKLDDKSLDDALE